MWFWKSEFELCQETWSLCVWLAVAPAGLCEGPRPPGREPGLLELPLYQGTAGRGICLSPCAALVVS